MKLPWLSHYDPGVPASLQPYPAGTLLDALTEAARTHPDAPALLFKGASVSYSELERQSDACATALAHLGVARGDRVALLLPNCPQFFVAEFAAWKIGAVAAPISPLYSARELEIALNENGIETIVTLTRYYKRVKQVQPQTPLTRVIATNIKAYFPPFLRLLFTLVREKRDGDRVVLQEGDYDLGTLI
ncbi:MAG: AMP-binding protein, partial [Vicinamibacterales bacterium]